MITNLFIFTVALFLVVKGATLATRYAARLAESYRLSPYTVGFIIVAVISILPETFVAINAAIHRVPSFGLGMLFGSNIADLTLVFAAVVFFIGRGVKIESKILKNHVIYPFLLLIPLMLGIDGYYSRLEGFALVVVGSGFYYFILRNGAAGKEKIKKVTGRLKSFVGLLFSMAILLVASHFVVEAAVSLASRLGINTILIGMFIVGLGTTLPELFFSLKSVKEKNDALAVGDLLGTVLADATIVVGILALVRPFTFPQKIIYITGLFMFMAAFILFHFMQSGRTLTKREAFWLVAFWFMFASMELIVSL